MAKNVIWLYEDVKAICKVILFKKMLFIVDLGIGKMFYTSTMLAPSYFSIIFLAKAKTRLQDFKLNIFLEQSNEIVYFFICW